MSAAHGATVPYGPLSYDGPPPATGAWREGDPVGERRFLDIGDVEVTVGTTIPAVRVAYQTWGRLNEERTNAVYVCHALTGDSHVTGDAGPGHLTAGWWAGLVGPGAPVDTDRWFVVCANVLGGCQGTTGPASLAPDGRAWGTPCGHVRPPSPAPPRCPRPRRIPRSSEESRVVVDV